MNYQSYQDDSLHLDTSSPFYLDHVSRYWWGKDLVGGKNVLDCACGKGYGSYILSHNAKKVVGIDLNESSLELARKTFTTKGNLEYRYCNVLELEKLEQKFDVIVAFEIIEHLPPEQTDIFLEGLKKALSPGGIVILSTPNHDVVLKSRSFVPDFHINNFKANDLRKKLLKHFSKVTMLGQYYPKGIFYNTLFTFDFFNLRHIAKNIIRPKRKQTTGHLPETQKNGSVVCANDFDTPPNPVLKYKFSPYHWRQAGLSVAICA